MATARKYASLPGIDNAPDIYETPELTDDTSTIPDPSTTVRSPSPSSSLDDADVSGISRQRLDPDQARSHFLSSELDAKGVDFSDRISNKRRSYRTSTKRRHRRRVVAEGQEEYENSSDDEEESLEQRLARLRSEMLEVKAEVERRREERQRGEKPGEDEGQGDVADEVENLNEMLEGVQYIRSGNTEDAITRLEKMLDTDPIRHDSAKEQEPKPPQRGDRKDLSVPLSNSEHVTLARAAEIDSRLTFLEKALGMPAIDPLASQSPDSPAERPILPTLQTLHSQISLLSSPPSADSLDAISTKLHQLVTTTARLDEARKSALASQEALLQQQITRRPLSSSSNALFAANNDQAREHLQQLSSLEDPDQVAKINALYGTIGTIESLAPLLPQVLDRLRSLRIIHTGAATASQSLDALERKQGEIGEDIRRWRDGLEKVEEAIRGAQEGMKGNVVVVEGWVKDLEQRMGKLE